MLINAEIDDIDDCDGESLLHQGPNRFINTKSYQTLSNTKLLKCRSGEHSEEARQGNTVSLQPCVA